VKQISSSHLNPKLSDWKAKSNEEVLRAWPHNNPLNPCIPGSLQHMHQVCSMALLSMVHSLKHAIYFATFHKNPVQKEKK
jgi:hypothetical protein